MFPHTQPTCISVTRFACALAALALLPHLAASQTTPADGNWRENRVSLTNTPQAAYMVRVGDIDNLNFGFPPGYDPFSGASQPTHEWPTVINPADVPGMDRVVAISSFTGDGAPCFTDGYSASAGPANQAVPYRIPLALPQGLTPTAAVLQLYADDFQPLETCARYRVWLNGTTRAPWIESVLNVLRQSGPVAKLVSIPFPANQLHLLQAPELTILIDDSTTRAGEGYAIDFIKLLVNPTPGQNRATARGVLLSASGQRVPNARIVAPNNGGECRTDAEGRFTLPNQMPGIVVVSVTPPNRPAQTLALEATWVTTDEPIEYTLGE
jgi:hypothetical protein